MASFFFFVFFFFGFFFVFFFCFLWGGRVHEGSVFVFFSEQNMADPELHDATVVSFPL